MDHVAINRDHWDGVAEHWVANGERLWALEVPEWGNWNTDEIDLLPARMDGLEAVELGCGTGYVSGWMARRGAQVTALDVSAKQLETARRLAAAHGATIDIREGNAEETGLESGRFDFAISEYGAAIWCPPKVWLSEAARILKPGGRLVFLGNHPLLSVTTPLNGAENDLTLHRPYRDLHVMDWTEVEIEPGGVSFNLSMGNWVALFLELGFLIEDFKEVYAPEGHDETRDMVPGTWAQTYPAEQVWYLRKD